MPLELPQGPLVSVDWLDAHRSEVRLVDVRGEVRPPGEKPRYFPKRGAYDDGHLPGAVFVDWTRDIVDLNDPVPVQIARAEHFASTMSSIGVGESTVVVAYDDYRSVFAARFAWALRYYGHDAVRVLDGGWQAWLRAGKPTTREVPKPETARFASRPRPELRRTANEVAAALEGGKALLIDARAKDQYDGVVSAAARKGHIPGAKSVPYASLFDDEWRMKDAAALAATFAEAGVDPKDPRPIVAYCNGGVTACAVRNALAVLGRDDVAIYDGSWNEWGNDSARPIE